MTQLNRSIERIKNDLSHLFKTELELEAAFAGLTSSRFPLFATIGVDYPGQDDAGRDYPHPMATRPSADPGQMVGGSQLVLSNLLTS